MTPVTGGIAGVLALAVLIAVVVPWRWLPIAIIAFVVSPVLIGAGLAGWEVATRPADPNAAHTLIYGLLLIGSFVAAPWLLLCAVGFGAGLALRLASRGGPAPAAAPPPAPPRPASAPPAPCSDWGVTPRSASPPRPGPWAAWRTALVLLVGACLAIAGATAMTLRAQPSASPALTPLPAMPRLPDPPSPHVPPRPALPAPSK